MKGIILMSIKRLLVAGVTGSIVLLGGASVASAHASIPSDDLTAAGYGHIAIRVPHGCEGLPTNIVEVQIPDGFTAIKPQAKAGWTVETEMVTLAEPIEMHGNTITERVGVIRWSGGNLADDQFDDFGISLKAPDAAGTVAEFPTIQYCGDASVAWIGEDAPSIDIVAGAAGHGSSDGHGDAAAGEEMAMPSVDPAQLESLQAAVAAIEDRVAEVASAQAEASVTAPVSEDEGSSVSPLAVVALLSSLAALGVGVAALKKS
jgi:uncharacterized protein YcnI